VTESTTGKGRPTPKRSETTKRKGPVAPPPTSRREAAKQLRAKQAADRNRMKDGLRRGDESVLLKRDRGPVRKMVRDLVDGRRSLGWVLMPVALIVIVSGFMGPGIYAMVFAIWLASLAAVAIDMTFIGIEISRTIRRDFPEEPRWSGHIRYGLLRTTMMRRFRMPRPAVHP
jgi:hypothetical protein